MLEIITDLEIDATPDAVWALFSDPAKWTGFSELMTPRRPERPFEVGATFAFRIAPKGMLPMKIKAEVKQFESGRLMWSGGFPGFRGEHYFRADPIEDGKRTRWVHGERFRGLVAVPVILLVRSKLEAAYHRFNRDLAAAVT